MGGMRRGPAGLWWARSYEFCFEKYQFLQRFWSESCSLSKAAYAGSKHERFGVPSVRSLEKMKNLAAGGLARGWELGATRLEAVGWIGA